MKEFICTVCPRGCKLIVDSELYEIIVTGNACERGKEYAISEYTNPVRPLTLNIVVEGGVLPVVSAKCESMVQVKKLLSIARLTKRMKVQAPIKAGQVLFGSVLGEKIIATRTVAKAENNGRK